MAQTPSTTRKDDILCAAKTIFSATDYRSATLRAIAAEAEVDVALIGYYFGSKQQLFRAAMNLPADPLEMVLEALKPGEEGAGERLVAKALSNWEDAASAGTMNALLGSFVSDAETGDRFRNYIRREVLGPLTRELGTPDAAIHLTLAMSQMLGILLLRYITRVEPLASLSTEKLARIAGDAVQRELFPTPALPTCTCGGVSHLGQSESGQ